MDIKSIKFENYKCFKNSEINNLQPINIIIGKNNIGKSSILDILEMVYDIRPTGNTKITAEKTLTDFDIKKVFREGTYGALPGSNHYEFGKKFIGKDFKFEITCDGKYSSTGTCGIFDDVYSQEYAPYWIRLANNISYDRKKLKRILAERNIFPEEESENMNVDSNGNGITTIISNYLNKSQYDENLVRNNLLIKLNEIMGEDANFSEIVTQQIKINNKVKWELFLREDSKGRIALSDSGSGLKTILMVLVYTILLPNVEKKSLSDYIFMFEELENNLHPALQRRLLKYLENLTKSGATFFLTTHSNVMLDTFQNNKNVNILHVQKEDESSIIINSSNNIQKNKILNDLGIKASDLLQSNGIIWVEGPSDRIYINKWISLWSNDTLREGKDYQCVFYGGRLLSNLSLSEKIENDLINLLNVNRNSIIVIDSDKKNNNSKINITKRRIRDEAKKNNIMCWITKGREIENYIPDKLVKRIKGFNSKKKTFSQFENMEDFLDSLRKGLGKEFLRDKINFAREMTINTTIEDYKNSLDLDIKMNNVIQLISLWNK